MLEKITYEYVKNYIESRNCLLLNDSYINKTSKLNIMFSCGHTGSRSFAKFMETLPICSKCSGNVKYTIDEINEKLYNYGFTLMDGQEYIGANYKLDFYDSDGYKYSYSIHCLDNAYKRGWNIGRRFDKRNKYILYNMELWLKKNNKNFSFVCDKYEGTHTCNIHFKCNVCGFEWTTAWSNIYSTNTGCSECGHKSSAEKNSTNSATNEYNISTLYPFLLDDWDYEKNDRLPETYSPGSNLKVYWKCKQCGYKWESQICTRTSGRGCPACGLSGGAKRIYHYLQENHYTFDIEHKFNNLLSDLGNPLRYDFSILDGEKSLYLIEYDSLLHDEFIPFIHKTINEFEQAQRYDKMKDIYAMEHNIPLLRIKEKDFKNIEQILTKELNLQERR